jgi:hypothetical protein
MLLQLNEQTRIEDPRQYGADVVNDLHNLLTGGGCAQRDPRRENFYELENDAHTFYIHVSPINGDVILLAKWLNSAKEACTSVAHVAA